MMQRQLWRMRVAAVRSVVVRAQRTQQPSHMLILSHISAFSSSASASAVAAKPQTTDSSMASVLQLLEESIKQQQPAEALAYFDRLDQPLAQESAQKLALLLAKHSGRRHTTRAFELLRSVYTRPGVVVDDFTMLASIHVVDACLRHKMLEKALEIYEEAINAGVVLDLPAVDALLKALIEADKVADAVEILKEVTAAKDLMPTQQTFFPVLLALMERCEYREVISVLDYGRKHEVIFDLETYDPLVELGEDQEEDPDNHDGLEAFMTYVNGALEDDGLMADFEDTIEFDDGDDEGDHQGDDDDIDDDEDDEFN